MRPATHPDRLRPTHADPYDNLKAWTTRQLTASIGTHPLRAAGRHDRRPEALQ